MEMPGAQKQEYLDRYRGRIEELNALLEGEPGELLEQSVEETLDDEDIYADGVDDDDEEEEDGEN